MPSTFIDVAVDHPSFAGHFPGQPVLPGVVILSEVLEALQDDASAALALGEAPQLGAVKFLQAVGPGARLQIQWEVGVKRIAFQVHLASGAADALIANGHFDVAVPPSISSVPT